MEKPRCLDLENDEPKTYHKWMIEILNHFSFLKNVIDLFLFDGLINIERLNGHELFGLPIDGQMDFPIRT